MARALKTLAQPKRPDAAALRQLATADPSLPPPVMSATGSEVINLRVSPDLIDQLDAAAEAEHTTRKVMITRALAAAGYRVRPADLEDRTPKTRRSRRAMA
jgi:predicted transcriptional regulator